MRGSQRIRDSTTAWSALFAPRSPPRFSRWRMVLPLLAGIGATPQRWANAASERIRCGLAPAVVSNWPATSVPTPTSASRRGVGDEPVQVAVGVADLIGEVLVAHGQAAQRQNHGGAGIVQRATGLETSAGCPHGTARSGGATVDGMAPGAFCGGRAEPEGVRQLFVSRFTTGDRQRQVLTHVHAGHAVCDREHRRSVDRADSFRFNV